MTLHTRNIDPALTDYLRNISEPEHPALAALRARSAGHRLGKMAIAPEQAALLTWLARLMHADFEIALGVHQPGAISKSACLPATAAPLWH